MKCKKPFQADRQYRQFLLLQKQGPSKFADPLTRILLSGLEDLLALNCHTVGFANKKC